MLGIVARQLRIDEKQIRQWRRQKDCIQKEMNDGCSRKRRLGLRGGGQKAARCRVTLLMGHFAERETSTGHTTINCLAAYQRSKVRSN